MYLLYIITYYYIVTYNWICYYRLYVKYQKEKKGINITQDNINIKFTNKNTILFYLKINNDLDFEFLMYQRQFVLNLDFHLNYSKLEAFN
jgi:hypothetical protein